MHRLNVTFWIRSGYQSRCLYLEKALFRKETPDRGDSFRTLFQDAITVHPGGGYRVPVLRF